MDFQALLSFESLIALLTLTFLEVVLGIDNIIFISIVSNKLSEDQRARARNTGLLLALIFRIALLMGITWVIKFTQPLFTVLGHDFSGRDLILAAGGLFLIFKSTMEVHHKIEGPAEHQQSGASATFLQVVLQIILLDIIFSFDSILTAIGLTEQVALMVIAVTIAMIIMMLFSGKISGFLNKHPTLEILALSFLILIGFMLIVEALHYHVPKGYIYFAVFFSLLVEILNLKIRKKRNPLVLHKRMGDD
ncbi:MAG: TerC family protein [Cyclobacteriaceae bacterium]|nr:TerC family protein [Cyclobacteriaceae bacterium]